MDKYEFLQPLGRSGNGNSYKVRERGTGKLLVFKILSDELQQNEKRMAAMKSGSRVASGLSHANMVKTTEFAKDRNYGFYMLRDYIEGRTLSELLKAKGVLNQVEFMDIFYQAASGLAYLHRKGYMHGQLKPNNIIITSDYAVKVVDVGVRRNMIGAPDGSEVIGDAHYLSPEQCLGRGIDQHADIYSFACMMYEAISQNKPFIGLNNAEIRQQQIKQAPMRFAELVPPRKVEPQIESVIFRCLAKDPSERYPSFDILQTDLRRIEQGEEIKDIPKNTGLPQIVLIAGALLLVLLVAGGVSFYFSFNGKQIAANLPATSSAGTGEDSAGASADERKADDLIKEKNYTAAAELLNTIEPGIAQQQGASSRQHMRVLHKLAKTQLYAHDSAAARDSYGVLVQEILENPSAVPPGYQPQMEVYAISKELLAADSLPAAGRGFSLAFELDKMMNKSAGSSSRYHFLIWEGKCHTKQKSYDAAEDCLKKALSAFRTTYVDPKNLAFALTEYGREQLEKSDSPEGFGNELKLLRVAVRSLNESLQIEKEQNQKAEMKDTRVLLLEARKKLRAFKDEQRNQKDDEPIESEEKSSKSSAE